MNFLVVGVSHRTAPVSLLERLAASTAQQPALMQSALTSPHVGEVVAISTCNRVELYASVATFHGALADLAERLATFAHIPLAELAEYLYAYYADEAVSHVMRVAAGLDSLVVGEPQILGQLRAAYAQATEARATGTMLHELMQHALRAGKKVHAQTDIDHVGPSIVSAALELGRDVVPQLTEASALVVGAGAIASVAAATLRRSGVKDLVIVNRTPERAARLAASVGATAQPLQNLSELLADADVVVCGTGSPESVVTVEHFARAREPHRPLLICDVALPRDTELAVADLPGVTVVDIEELQRRLPAERSAALGGAAAQAIIDEEIAAFIAWHRAIDVAPTVAALRARASSIVASELESLVARMPTLDDAGRVEVERTIRRVVNTLLHAPTVRMKELAAAPDGTRYADAVRELFLLDVATTKPPAVSENIAAALEVRP